MILVHLSFLSLLISTFAAILLFGAISTVQAQLSQAGLVVHLDFAGGFEDSAGAFDGIIPSGVPTFDLSHPQGTKGAWSASFNGIDDHVRIKSGVLSDCAADYTVSACYHVMSRTVNGEFLFGATERESFRRCEPFREGVKGAL